MIMYTEPYLAKSQNEGTVTNKMGTEPILHLALR